MSIALALSGTLAGNFLFAAWLFLVLKLLSALFQASLMRGDYRHLPGTWFFRIIYATGKIAPAIACGCFFASAWLLHDRFYSWFFGCLTVFVACLAGYVVYLRKRGRFFGMADLVSSTRGR